MRGSGQVAVLEGIKVDSVGKRFGPHLIFRGVSFEAATGGSVCLWGPNGSGKSTLLKIAAGLIRASEGSVTYQFSGAGGRPARFRNAIGVCAPDVVYYEELTPEENLEFLSSVRGLARDVRYENELLERFGLEEYARATLGTFSSGMLQRFKFIAALAHRPRALLLDEPSSYVDEAGRARMAEIVKNLKPGVALVVATNDPRERAWCEGTVELHIENIRGR